MADVGPSPGLAARVLQGDIRAASRLMRLAEDRTPGVEAELRTLYGHTGKALVIGITGAPGAGKSTFTSGLTAALRRAGKTVGVLAVDPSSPFTGGALLGDRIRMQEHASDPEVFIRSLATRGQLGGLSRATADCVLVMDALGKDVILVETVGVGQDEIDVARLAHCTLLLLVPGLGDDIQAIKAGILEVADVFVVNKSDLDGADRVVRELRLMLELRHATLPKAAKAARAAKASVPTDWDPPIVKTVAARREGIDEVWSAVERHQAFLVASGQDMVRNRSRATTHFLALLQERLMRGALERLEHERGRLEDVAGQLVTRETDPYSLAEGLAESLADGLTESPAE